MYASTFIAFGLVFLPRQVLLRSGIGQPVSIGIAHVAGVAVAVLGAALIVWCIGTFAVVGKGTPAPFDPPRKLVVAGPYRFVRNPMYIGAGLALAGAALYYGSYGLWLYVSVFMGILHGFVMAYEEPTLRATFGADYVTYCGRVRRWMPNLG